MDPAQKVLEATKAFDAALPSLIERGLSGRWVVFLDSGLVGDYATQSEAYKAAVAKFGRDGGFAVLQVGPREATPISAVFQFA